MSPEMAGSGSLSASALIQRNVKERETPKICPSILNEALPMEYRITAKARFAASDSFTRRSPSMKLHPHFRHR